MVTQHIGPYALLKKLASGGMAEIFLARQQAIEGFSRSVVLKRVLPEHNRNAEFVTMFLDEARLMAALSHPHIVQALDLGNADGSYYLVMEYVNGPTLGELLRPPASGAEPLLPAAEALTILLAIAEALAYVHELRDELGRPLNVVHRDLNPANVLVSYSGAVKLIDFGIAKAASKVYQTRGEVIKGTHGYIAPEQFAARHLDHRADVYALGVMLYQVCVGVHPFETEEAAAPLSVVQRMMQGLYPPPEQLRRDLPPSLASLINHCLAVDPEARPPGVPSVIERLNQLMRERRLLATMTQLGKLAQQRVPARASSPPMVQTWRPAFLSSKPPTSPVTAIKNAGPASNGQSKKAGDAMAHADTLMVDAALLPQPTLPQPTLPQPTLPQPTLPPPLLAASANAALPPFPVASTPRAPAPAPKVLPNPALARPLRLDSPLPELPSNEHRLFWLGVALLLLAACGFGIYLLWRRGDLDSLLQRYAEWRPSLEVSAKLEPGKTGP